MASAAEEALRLKEKGNAAFKVSDFDEAINAYSQALELDQTQHLCFSNRSAAYLKLGCKSGTAEASKADFLGKALADANKCVEINPTWIKGYSRQAAVLQELKRWDDAVNACQTGLNLENDAALEKMRNEVLNRRFQSHLIGTWHGTVSEVLGGYDQEMEFLDEKSVRVTVLGRSIVGMYWVDATQTPHHLNIQVPMADAQGMPPPPPVPYIARIETDGLHICCPFMKMDRPTAFDGPGYCLMSSGPLGLAAEGAETANMSPEQQLIECAKDLAQALPDSKIEDLSQTDGEEATRDKLMMQVRFESSMYGVQRKFGEEVMKKVLEATKSGPVPAALAGTPELKSLQDKLSMCGLLDAVATEEKAPGSSAASNSKTQAREQPAKEQTPGKEAEEAGRQDRAAAAADRSSALSLQVVGALTLGAAIATVALVWWRRRQTR